VLVFTPVFVLLLVFVLVLVLVFVVALALVLVLVLFVLKFDEFTSKLNFFNSQDAFELRAVGLQNSLHISQSIR